MINIRKTARAQNLPSEASYRYSRGVHPSMAEKGLLLALELMAQWSGGESGTGARRQLSAAAQSRGGGDHGEGCVPLAGDHHPAGHDRRTADAIGIQGEG